MLEKILHYRPNVLRTFCHLPRSTCRKNVAFIIDCTWSVPIKHARSATCLPGTFHTKHICNGKLISISTGNRPSKEDIFGLSSPEMQLWRQRRLLRSHLPCQDVSGRTWPRWTEIKFKDKLCLTVQLLRKVRRWYSHFSAGSPVFMPRQGFTD